MATGKLPQRFSYRAPTLLSHIVLCGSEYGDAGMDKLRNENIIALEAIIIWDDLNSAADGDRGETI
jgi:hypothetical protein